MKEETLLLKLTEKSMPAGRKRLPKLRTVPTLDDVERIQGILRDYVRRTPVLQSEYLNAQLGMDLYFKCENLQRIGSFKLRGALSAALALSDKELGRGLVTHSSGNHGQGVAFAAKLLGVPAYVVMPSNSAKSKVKACERYGAKVIFCEPNNTVRQEVASGTAAKYGASLIHPADDYQVIAGQGTAALEMLGDTGRLHYLIAPVSSGGLLAGTSVVAGELSPTTKVIGAEPEMADDAYRSFMSGKRKRNKTSRTICDGLRGELAEKTFPIILDKVHDIVTVKEKTIVKAMKMIWSELKIIVEPSCAVSLAVVLENKKRFRDCKVGMILTGGNVDLDGLPF